MAVCMVWAWVAGEGQDGAPVVEKRLAEDDARPADAPQSAWLAEQDVAAWREEIMAALDGIDAKSIRALREADAARLAALEAEAERLRNTLRRLPNA
jgi:hypothetical protein